MENKIIQLEPKTLWKHFYAFTQIPRPSSHEQEVVKYIEEFALTNKLDYTIDKVGNILVKKPGTKDKEDTETIILQSHVDMVPQKNSDKVHDFEKDPIETIIDGEWLTANDTTLGADNGIGCAAMLSVLESEDIQHGPIEALFTINEEAGMEGAFGLKPDLLTGNILLNLDSEDEGALFVGCAGGLNVQATTTYNTEGASTGTAYQVSISGLKGGHSGLDIHLGRGNSNKILGRLLWSAMNNLSVKIASVKGGDLRNAIPREASATIVIDSNYTKDFEQFVQTYFTIVQNELKLAEPDFLIETKQLDILPDVISDSDAKRIVGCLNAAPSGVSRMSDTMEGTPETSLNLAIVNVVEHKAEFFYLVRSFVDSAKYALGEQVTALHEINGFSITSSGDYPGWQPNNESYILKVCSEIFNEQFNKQPEKLAMHAGLETGIIGGKYPGMDMISIGPNIRFPHSPDEKVQIKSVENFYNYLLKVLETV